MKVTMRIDGLTSDIGADGVTAAKEICLEIPRDLGKDYISRLKKDIQILHKNENNIHEIFQSFTKRNPVELSKALKKHGMDEDSAIEEGGGLLLQLLIIAAILLYASEAK